MTLRGLVDNMNPAAYEAKLGQRTLHVVTLSRELHDDHATQRLRELNCCSGSPGLAIGSGSKKKILIANTFSYLCAGVPKNKTTAEVAFTNITDDITANASAARERWYLLSIVANGTVTVTPGVQGAVGAGTIPATPSFSSGGAVPIGLVRIEIASGVTDFAATDDDLDAAHVTDEYYNLVGCGNPTDLYGALAATKPSAFA